MKLTLTRIIDKSWIAVSDCCKCSGTGKTRAEAIDSLVRANLDTFGITEWEENDPESKTPRTVWHNYEKEAKHAEGLMMAEYHKERARLLYVGADK